MIHVRWQSTNDEATYTVTARGETGLHQCSSTGESCTLGGLPCGSLFSVTAVAETPAGRSLPSHTVPLETGTCTHRGVPCNTSQPEKGVKLGHSQRQGWVHID